MKTIEKTRYHKPELDAYIAQKFEEAKQHIIINAQSFAVKNLPPLQNRKMQSYFEEDHLRYQALIDGVNVELQFKAICNEVVEHTQLMETQLRAVYNKLAAEKEKQIAIDAKLKSKKPSFSKVRQLLAWSAIAIITVFEGLLACPVFETWGYSLAEAFCMSLLFAGVLAIFAHTFERIVSLGKTLWQRRMIAFGLILLLATLFSFMAEVRAEYLSKLVLTNSADGINVHFSPLPFVFTSLLLFIVAVAVCHFFLPSREERNAMREYKHILKEQKENKAVQQQLEQEIAAKQLENAELKKVNASILEYGCMLEELIISNAYGGFALWKKQNMMYRPDNGRPLSFDDPTYPMCFNTNFHSLKLL